MSRSHCIHANGKSASATAAPICACGPQLKVRLTQVLVRHLLLSGTGTWL
jgi:hypothetical protein